MNYKTTKFKIIFLLVILLFSFLGMAKSSQAANIYYMAPDGNDANNGLSESSPWQTFDFAVTKLNPGDTLVLLDGNYTTAGSGNFYADCGAGGNAKNGTETNPITIKSINQRKAWIKNDGYDKPFQLMNCNWWTIDGLTITSRDNLDHIPGNNASGILMTISAGSHNIIRNNLWARVNRYAGGGGLVISGGGTGNLVEGNELYDFDRNGIFVISSNGNIFRRNYCRSGEYGADDPERTGPNDCFVAYYANDNIFENNVAQDNEVCFSASGKRNKFLGNITINCNVPLSFGTHPQQTMIAENNYAKDQIGIGGPSSAESGNGFNSRSAVNSIIENSSFFGPVSMNGIAVDNSRDTRRGIGACGGYYPDQPCPESVDPGITVRNVLIKDTPGGIYIDHYWEYITRVIEYTVGWNNPSGTWRQGTETRDLNSTPPAGVSIASDIGNCLVWIPDGSSLKGKGKNGADIGADVLYRYENGVLTNSPLWNTSSGEFTHGAIVPGINDVLGKSLFDVHQRLNVNTNGCAFPPGYGGDGDTTPPSAPSGLQVN